MDAEASSRLESARAVVSRTLGLDFPPERWSDLGRGLAEAAPVLGFADAEACLRWLAEAPALSTKQRQHLASVLTVGETYFNRETQHLELLATGILPQLLEGQRGRRIVIWSAGCCTGEEAYSIAMVLQQLTAAGYDCSCVTVIATDVNEAYLSKARRGRYGPWSFRNVPEHLKQIYFHLLPGGQYQIKAEIARFVRFAPQNLAEPDTIVTALGAGPVEIIFCRNVLMYFAPAVIRDALAAMHRLQPQGGWLFVGASELVNLSSSPYARFSTGDIIAYRKAPFADLHCAPPEPRTIMPANEPEARPASRPRKPNTARSSTRRPDPHAPGARPAVVSASAGTADKAHALVAQARALADGGELAAALACCDQAIAADCCHAGAHYMRAVILQEQGRPTDAAASVRRALYLAPACAPAHLAAAVIARARGRYDTAERHLLLAMEQVRSLSPADQVSDSDGMTVGELRAMIGSLRSEAMP